MARRDHPGTIEHRGSNYRVILYIEGERHTATPKTEAEKRMDPADFARDAYDRLEAQAKRTALGLPGPMPISELFDRYEQDELDKLKRRDGKPMAESTAKAYRSSLQMLRAFFVEIHGDPLAHEVRPGHVKAFSAWREEHSPRGDKVIKRKVGPRAVGKDRAVLSAIFSYATEYEIVDRNPVAATSPPSAPEREAIILEPHQYEALLDACDDPMLRLFVLTCAETGARSESEVLHLRWADVDLEGGFVRVVSGRDGHRTKSGKSRWVPMTRRLREAMKEHFAAFRFKQYRGKRAQHLFHHRHDRRRAKAGQRIGSLRRGFNAACDRAADALEKQELDLGGLRDLNQHDLRHTRITTWLAEGRDVTKVKEAVGHANLQTTMRYTHLAREHLRSLVEEPDQEARERQRQLGS